MRTDQEEGDDGGEERHGKRMGLRKRGQCYSEEQQILVLANGPSEGDDRYLLRMSQTEKVVEHKPSSSISVDFDIAGEEHVYNR
jgi:hypothetical protein